MIHENNIPEKTSANQVVMNVLFVEILKLKIQQKENFDLCVVNDCFEKIVGFGLEQILAIPGAELVSVMKNEQSLSDSSLERLGDILFHLADCTGPEYCPALAERTSALYKYVDETALCGLAR